MASCKFFSLRRLAIATTLVVVTSLLLLVSFPSQEELLKKRRLHTSELCRVLPPDSTSCPAYFRWIESDLAAWEQTGISRETLEAARSNAHFRLTILSGRLYMEHYGNCDDSRAEYTIRGLLMLLQKYHGQVPDVEMMFACMDFPHTPRKAFRPGTDSWPPPPLFVYCTTLSDHYDIVFPDWSFWGWPEVNIRSWSEEQQRISSEARRTGWHEREPVAFWKGNFKSGPTRAVFHKCAKSSGENFSLITQDQDWGDERKNSFKTSDLAKQCMHRFKVYIEGWSWSVSFKYIMQCGSTVLKVDSIYHEFFTRSLQPLLHYWPINRTDMCNSIKDAVEQGNTFPEEAEKIAMCGQLFLETELTMDLVYQYMLHLLRRYSKLLRFTPIAPPGAKLMSLDPNSTSQAISIKSSRELCYLD